MNNHDNKDLSNIEDLIKVEDEAILNFVKETPYPNYEEMLEKLDDHIDLWSEYGEYQHLCCKIIYENPTNKNIIVERGKQIYKMGGKQALSAIHTIIKYFSPYWNSENIIIKMQGRIIEEYFQEVTPEWKA